MDFNPESYDVLIPVPFLNPAGVAETPSSVTAVVVDGDNQLVVDLGIIPVIPEQVEATIQIPGVHVILPVGEKYAVQVLVVEIAFALGSVTKNFSYAIEADVTISLMENSFMTYDASTLIALEIFNKTGWEASDENMRRSALTEAFHRIMKIPMKYYERDEVGGVVPGSQCFLSRNKWFEVDAAAFVLFPADFKKALRKAQFIEADHLLRGDTIASKRREGILVEEVAESTVKLSGALVDYGVSYQTLDALTGYVDFSMRIGRG